MQSNSDEVVNNILKAEKLLIVVRRETCFDIKLCNHNFSSFTINLCFFIIIFTHQDNENDKKEKKFEHKDEINKILGIAEGLLEKLFLDIGNLKLINYPHVAAVEAEWVHETKPKKICWASVW